MKNVCSKEIGTKMKNKEPQGDDDQVPASIAEKLEALTAEDLKVYTHMHIHKAHTHTCAHTYTQHAHVLAHMYTRIYN